MKQMKRNSGIALLEVLIAITILSVVMTGVSVYMKHRAFQTEVNTASDQLVDELVMIQQYESESPEDPNSVTRFPTKPEDLVTKGYADACTDQQQQTGVCRSVRNTFWGEAIKYKGIDGANDEHISTHLEMTYPLTFFKAEEAKKVSKLFMSRIPFSTYDDATQAMTIRVNRSSASRAMDDYLDRFGNTTLKDDWDVGGDYRIANAKNYLVKTEDGNQMNVAAGVIASFAATSETQVPKPSCPDGLKPAISTSIKALTGASIKATGAQRTYYVDGGDSWTVKLSYYAQNQSDDKWGTYTDGEINVLVSCVTDDTPDDTPSQRIALLIAPWYNNIITTFSGQVYKMLNKKILLLPVLIASSSAYAVDTSHNYQPVSRENQDDMVVANSDGEYCTGTLLGGKYVITAAHCNTGTSINSAYQGLVAVSQTHIPTDYTAYMSALQNHEDITTPMLDVAIWQSNTDVKHTEFAPISNVAPQDNDLERVYGFGETNPNLGYIQQRYLENWHFGGAQASESGTQCQIHGATTDDGFCETVKPNMVISYEISQGRIIDGDSGSAFLNDKGYITGILHSRTPFGLQDATNPYHNAGGSLLNIEDVVADDAELDSMNGSYANRLAYEPTETFILDNVDAWNYPSWVKSVPAGQTVQVEFQSLNKAVVDLNNTISTSGDVSVDTSTITCYAPEQEDNNSAHHSDETVQPFDVCSMSVTSNGDSGEITLEGDQVIHVNAWDTGGDTPDDGGDTSGEGGSGGSFGLSGLLALFGLGAYRRVKSKSNR